MFQVVRCLYQDRPAGEASEWLRVIREANVLCDAASEERVFGAPTHLGEWWAGGSVEEYPEARVIFAPERSTDSTVRIVPLTERADRLIQEAFVVVRNEG